MQRKEHDKHQKDSIMKEQAAERVKIRCRVCFKETFPNPKCFGHGGGSGSPLSHSSEKTSHGHKQTKAYTLNRTASGPVQATHTTTDRTTSNLEHSQPTQSVLDTEIISELLSKKLLSINNDREIGTLTIRRHGSLGMLSEEEKKELKQFITAIIATLEEFKKDKKLSSNYTTIDRDNEGGFLSLQITLPTPALYDAFVQQLANNYLLPKQNIIQKEGERVVYPDDGINLFNASPLSMRSARKSTAEKESPSIPIRPRTSLS